MAEVAGSGEPLLADRAADHGMSEELALKETGVARFPGFYENTYRLLFAFEDHYKWEGTKLLLTVLEDGLIATRKTLKAEKGKALFAHCTAKHLDASKFDELMEEHGDDIEPFIWKGKDGSVSRVHMWPVNYDASFKNKFRIFENNPSTAKFEPRAVEDFKIAIGKLFKSKDQNPAVGRRAPEPAIQYVIQQQRNDKPVYVGRGDKLLKFLELCPAVKDGLGIQTGPRNEFVLTVEAENQESTTKNMSISLDKDYALYTKRGNGTMACCKLWEEFKDESKLDKPDEAVLEIPNCLLASPLPRWSYDSDVARLFFNDKELMDEKCHEIPRPIPIECCVSKAVYWALARVIILWACVLSTTVLGYLSKDSEWYNRWHRVVFLFAALIGLWAEWQCVRFFIVPFVERVVGCAFPLLGNQPFSRWLPSMMFFSFISMVSIQLNAEFMLETIKREQNRSIEIRYWSYLMESSIFGRFHVDWQATNPGYFAGIMWCISAVQLLWPVFKVWPVHCASWPKCEVRCYSDTGESGVEWETLPSKLGISHQKMQPYEALLDLAYAGGMSTIGCGAYTYPLGSMKDSMKKRHFNWVSVSMDHLNLAQGQAVKRLFIDGFLKKTLQLKIQVTLYSLDRAVQKAETSSVNWMGLVPILITLFTGLLSQIDTVKMCLEQHHSLSCKISDMGEDNERKQLSWTTWKYSVCIAFLGIIILLGLGYNGMQLIATHFCTTALWNIRGCVSVEEIEHYKANFSSRR